MDWSKFLDMVQRINDNLGINGGGQMNRRKISAIQVGFGYFYIASMINFIFSYFGMPFVISVIMAIAFFEVDPEIQRDYPFAFRVVFRHQLRN